MKFTKLFTIVSAFALSVSAKYWDNVERTEFYSMIENKVPQIHVTLTDQEWNEIVQFAQVKSRVDVHEIPEYDAKMKFILDGKEEEYKIEFRLGGKSSMEFSRPGYNFKIKGSGKTLHGTKQFRLRSEQRDPTYMRTKLTSEILLKSGLITTDSGYTELYINNQYMGFWVISDSIKKSWITRNFGEVGEEVKTLYQCKIDSIRIDNNTAKTACLNAYNEFLDYKEPFNKFVDQVNASKTRADLEKFLDVDNFLKYVAWEYLVGSWDHFLGPFGHNLYWYQQPNGIWVYLPYDFDLDLGACLWSDQFSSKSYTTAGDNIQFPAIAFKDFELEHPIIKILVHDDDTRFREIIGDVVSKVFNPDTLLPRIDELKKLVEPYIKKNIETGAGKINKVCPKQANWTMDDFYENCEYTYLYDTKDYVKAFGLKDWIRRRYNTVAAYYGIDDKTHKLIEPRPEPKYFPYVEDNYIERVTDRMAHHHIGNPLPPYTPNTSYEDNTVPVIGVNQFALENKKKQGSSEQPKETTECWSSKLGYKCCSRGCNTAVVVTDNDGAWGVENGEWCGVQCDVNSYECPNQKNGYPCCQTCDVYLTDADGKWGVENGNW